ncbi:MAG: hypothetical protein FWD73_16490 [Polyangiaceae bacterium]|nr:hypothetical protein [Polyangiaceae bacterium]
MRSEKSLFRSADGSIAAAIHAVAIGLFLALTSFALYGGKTALSVAFGVAIGVANLLALRAIVSSLIVSPSDRPDTVQAEQAANAAHENERRRGGVAWGIFALLKIAILFGGLWMLLTRNVVSPIPLVIGYGALPIGITTSALATSLRPRT